MLRAEKAREHQIAVCEDETNRKFEILTKHQTIAYPFAGA